MYYPVLPLHTVYETQIQMCVCGGKICTSRAAQVHGSLVLALLRVVSVLLLRRPLEAPGGHPLSTLTPP